MMPTGLEQVQSTAVFDYSQLDEQTAQQLQNFSFRALQVARTYYRDLMEIVVGAHKLLCGTVVPVGDNGRFVAKEDTFRAWCTSVHISKTKAYQLLQIQDFMDNCTPEQQSTLALLPFTAMRELVTGDTPEQVITMAKEGKVSTSKEVLELKAQLKAEKERADAAEAERDAAIADVNGLSEQNEKLRQDYNAANDDRIAANLQRQKAEAQRDKAEARAKDVENQLAGSRKVAEAARLRGDKLKAENDALKQQPITAVVDEEEVDRRATEKARGLADARNRELAAEKEQLQKELDTMRKSSAQLERRMKTMTHQMDDLGHTDFETANHCPAAMLAIWNSCKGSYSRLTGEDLESTFLYICNTLNSIRQEAALLCRQPEGYDGGDA